MEPTRAVLSWSGGKDSALALYETSKAKNFEVVSLLTTLTRDFERVSMHGVRRALLIKQAERLDLPLDEVWITKGAPNLEYEAEMAKSLAESHKSGIHHVIFGDLYLEDIRRYREERLAGLKMNCVFPLWHRDTRELASHFVRAGFRALICTVDPGALDPRFCGREYDESFLSDLPESVDPCGENGEFHTFVYDGPVFNNEIPVRRGSVVKRDGFYFADILQAQGS